MDRIRFGRSIRALRARRSWRQQDVADAARISRSVVGRIERGELRNITWRDLEAVALALDGQLGLEFRWRGADLDRLIDADHASLVEALVGLYRAAGWETIVEATFSEYGERGSIDVLARHVATAQIAVNEVKATIGDAGGTVMGIDRKARLAPVVAVSWAGPASASRGSWSWATARRPAAASRLTAGCSGRRSRLARARVAHGSCTRRGSRLPGSCFSHLLVRRTGSGCPESGSTGKTLLTQAFRPGRLSAALRWSG